MKQFSAFFSLCFIFLATLAMLWYPQAAYQGAIRGLTTWSTHLVPSLLPFFIFADLLLSLGFVRFFGILLEPLMRPLFRLPGEAGFAVALGFTSGFPMGALLTTSLREQKLCTSQEASRLAAFTNNSSPLFLLISIPVSMLKQPSLGILLLSSHYLANLTIGIFLRFFSTPTPASYQSPFSIFRSAWNAMRTFQQEHAQPFGTLLGQAIQKGIQNILSIGGFVVFFSVLLSLLQISGVLFSLQSFFSALLLLLHFSPQLSSALSAGLLEMTLGAQTAAEANAPLLQQLMVISFLLGWSGLSVQAQVSSILSKQHISFKLYCLCRPLQGLLAALYIPLLLTLFPQILSRQVSFFLSPYTLPRSFLSFFTAPFIVLLSCLFLSMLCACLQSLLFSKKHS